MKLTKLLKDKRGVFGLTSVQAFFVIILGIALLGYVIVIIMGTLSSSNIIPTDGSVLQNNITNARLNNILGNTSTGITSFFSAINPVYAILAVLVIILVLVVLVRVVSGGSMGGGTAQL